MLWFDRAYGTGAKVDRYYIGIWADIVVFDPLSVRELSTYTEPKRYPEGIEYVFVNGVLTVEHGGHTGVLGGKPLKHRSVED